MSPSSIKMPRILNSKSRHSSVELVSTNNDLLTEILLHTPIKSLLKFKSVSKHWLSLITNPRFSRLRNPVHASPSGLFLLRNFSGVSVLDSGSRNDESTYDYIPLGNNARPPFTSLTFANHLSGMRVLQSCNGLFLCFNSAQRAAKRKYYVFNPTTKHFTLLPPIKVKNSRSPLDLYLAHDPSKSHVYKVVCVKECDELDNLFQIELYSFDTGPWRISGAPFTANYWTQLRNGVFFNGCIHWTSDHGPSLYFDIEKELVVHVPMPPGPEDRLICYFGESRGHLHLIATYNDGQTPTLAQLHVYEMSHDYSGWFVKYQVDLVEVAIAFPRMNISKNDNVPWYQFSILGLVREEVEEESYLVLYVPSVAIRYNIKDKTFVKIWDFNVDHFDPYFMLYYGLLNCIQYFESLSDV